MLSFPYAGHDTLNVWKFCYQTQWKFLMLWISSIPDGKYLCSPWFHEKMNSSKSVDIFFRMVVSKNGLFHYEVSPKTSHGGQFIRGNNGMYRIMFAFYATDNYDQALPDTPEYFCMDMGYLKYRFNTISRSKNFQLPFEKTKIVTVRVTLAFLRSAQAFYVLEQRVLKNYEIYSWTKRHTECMSDVIDRPLGRNGNCGDLGKILLKQTVEDRIYCDLRIETLSASGYGEYLYVHKCVLYSYTTSEPFRRLFLGTDSDIVLMHYWPRSVMQVLFSLIYTDEITWEQLDNQQDQLWWHISEIPWMYLMSFAHMYELDDIFTFAVVNGFKKISIPYAFSRYSQIKTIKEYAVLLFHLNLPQLAERYLAVLEFLNVDCEDVPCSVEWKRQVKNKKVKNVCMINCNECYRMNRVNNDDERYLIIE